MSGIKKKIEVGNLVRFNPLVVPGALTAVKYYQRIKGQIGTTVGVVVSDSGHNCSVIFGQKILTINKEHLELVNESR